MDQALGARPHHKDHTVFFAAIAGAVAAALIFGIWFLEHVRSTSQVAIAELGAYHWYELSGHVLKELAQPPHASPGAGVSFAQGVLKYSEGALIYEAAGHSATLAGGGLSGMNAGAVAPDASVGVITNTATRALDLYKFSSNGTASYVGSAPVVAPPRFPIGMGFASPTLLVLETGPAPLQFLVYSVGSDGLLYKFTAVFFGSKL